MKRIGIVLGVMVASLMFAGAVQAATYVWDNGGADMNWNTAANWDNGDIGGLQNTVPGNNDDAWFTTPSESYLGHDPTPPPGGIWNPPTHYSAVMLYGDRQVGSLNCTGSNRSIRGTWFDNDVVVHKLTISTGDITSSTDLKIGANVELGDTLANWDGSFNFGYANASGWNGATGEGDNNGLGWPGQPVTVTELMAGTDIVKTGTGTVHLGEVGGNHNTLIITGTLEVKEGTVSGGYGRQGYLQTYDVILGDDCALASTSATLTLGGGGRWDADITVRPGSSGARTIITTHGWSGGSYYGNIILNDDLTLKSGGPTYITGDISGTGNLVIERNSSGTAGNVEMSGDLTYSGTTTVKESIVFVTGTNNSGLGNWLVESGAGLGGGGTIGLASSVTIADGAHLLPGGTSNLRTATFTTNTTVGTLTIASGLVLDNDSQLDFQFGPDDVAGVDYDTMVVTDLTLDGVLNVDNLAGYNSDNGVYQIFAYSGTLTNNDLHINLPDGSIGYIQIVPGGSGVVKLVTGSTGPGVIPEPGTLLLLGTGVLGVLGYLRRRRMM